MDDREISRKITEGEYKIFKAIFNGHKAHDNDEFKDLRNEIENLRCVYFKEDPKFCKKKYRK